MFFVVFPVLGIMLLIFARRVSHTIRTDDSSVMRLPGMRVVRTGISHPAVLRLAGLGLIMFPLLLLLATRG